MSKKIPWVSMENVDTSKDGFIFFCKCCGVKYQVSYGFIQRYTPPKVVVFVDYSHPLVGLMGNDVALTYNAGVKQ